MTSSPPRAAAQPGADSFTELARRIAERDLPSFGLTLRELFLATEDASASGQRIAGIVLRDPALTSRVLRAANAAHLGLGAHARVVTVSRAVVVLGLNPIRSLCVSALTVEAMAGGARQTQRVQHALGRALHAAVQARDIGLRLRASREAAEQLFVEAMLGSIGELAFWCFGGALAQRLDQALGEGQPAEQAEAAVLGTTLRSFGRELLRAWNLDALLRDSREVALARRLGQAVGGGAAPGGGWAEPGVRDAVRAIGQLLGQGEADALPRLRDNAREALELARALGAYDAAASIPASAGPDATPPEPAPEPYPEPDPQAQLRVLTEMSQAARSRRELPLLLETCVEGLQRAVGLDRAALCLLNPARDRLTARIAIGPDAGALREKLHWDWNPEIESRWTLNAPEWCKGAEGEPAGLLRAAGATQGFVAPFVVDGQLLGLFYADRAASGRPLTSAQFESFQSFVALAQVIVRSLPRG
jgi:HD-like signal output (HDOD) protein